MKLLRYVSFAAQVRTLQTLRGTAHLARQALGVQLKPPAVRAVTMASTVMKVRALARRVLRELSSDLPIAPASHARLEAGVHLVQRLAFFAVLGLIAERYSAVRAARQVRLAEQLLVTARIAQQAGSASHRLPFVKFAQKDFTATMCQAIALLVQLVVLADQNQLTAASALQGPLATPGRGAAKLVHWEN